MKDEDLHCSRGPVSSMPGSSHSFPEGAKCDRHPNRLAVKRLQGETDSMGAEYFLACAKCVRGIAHYRRNKADEERPCDWCKERVVDVRPYRDMDEGMAGPVYQVCPGCRKRDQERWAAEAEASYDGHVDDFFDDDSERDAEEDRYPDDHFGPADEEPRCDQPQRIPTISYKKRRKVLERPS